MPNLHSLTRFVPLIGVLVLTLASFTLMLAWSIWFILPLGIFGVLSGMGLYDLIQTKHSILRN